MGLVKCIVYLAATGITAFFVGRLLPKKWFKADRFPYRGYAFEQNGRFYERFRVRFWQSKVPDMSKVFPRLMPAKKLSGDYREHLPRMLQETCVAELIHTVLCFTGLYCLKLWPGAGGVFAAVVHIIFFNLPYIIIQRYNRPRLMKLQNRLRKKQEAKTEEVETACEYSF